tara:strand:- start:6877 stop:8103 length:1227 start_codon:yes stop_codon:yes gene_type:complete
MDKPKVTVLIPIFNSEKTIKRAIESVNNQTYGRENIAILLFDDGSTDNSLKECDGLLKIGDSIKIYDKNMKRGFARNWLVQNCCTELAVWLDADDCMDAEKISQQVNYMTDNELCNYCQTKMWVGTFVENQFIVEGIKDCEHTDSYSQLEFSNNVNGCSVMFRTSIAKQFKYPEDIISDGLEDWAMWKQIILGGQSIHKIDGDAYYEYTLRKEIIVSESEKKIFRFDDISTNTDIDECNKIANYLKEKFPYSTIQYALSPLVYDLSSESEKINKERPFPKIFGALSDYRNFFTTNKIGLIDRGLIPNFVETKNHGLFHIDHRLLTKQQQEMSIISGACLTMSKSFSPPFNKYNSDTIQICNEFDLSLDKFEDNWKSMEHEVFDSKHIKWYLHPRFWDIKKIENYICNI